MADGFNISSTIYRSQTTEVQRATRESDGIPVILKTRSGLASNERREYLVHEYELYKTLEGRYLPKFLSFENTDQKSILVLQDDDMNSLEMAIPKGGFELSRFLSLAIEITSAIEEIHAEGVIHRNINPTNIIVNTSMDTIKLIDFGPATRISQELVGFEAPSVLRGSIPYISPEQTGRINKPVDSRSDLYSLGITFYRLITGTPPFMGTDPGELIYSHIARTPIPVFEIRQDIPKALASVIEKLLKKSPDERYQTATSIKDDLIFLEKATSSRIKIVDFIPAKNEQKKIILTNKLYGREPEISALLNCFNRCKNTGQLVTVTGPAGIGKTALIRELYTPITSQNGFFLTGKFDQLNKGLAYSAFADAFRDFVGQCSGQDEETLTIFRVAIQSSLGEFGQVLSDIVPELESLIGPQQSIDQVSPIETVAVRNNVFSSFIKGICAVGRPLVLFLDDLQWADSSTLSLLETMLNINPANLLIILSYRDGEISAAHPAKLFSDSIRNKDIEFTNLHLDNLSQKAVTDWISDILPEKNKVAKELASLVMTKTEGNPFYITSFLYMILEKDYIRQETNGSIFLDTNALADIPLYVDVLEHLIRKIESLKPRDADFLTRISILGNRFSINTIGLFLNEIPSDYHDAIQALVENHLLIKSGDIIMFAHDRIQQAAHAILDDNTARCLHLKAGINIKAALHKIGLSKVNIEEYIHHFNAAAILITDEKQRLELAELNTLLGSRLKSNAAYQAAEESFAQAIAFLPKEPFIAAYDLAIDLFTEYGETLFLNHKLEEGEKQFEAVIAHSKSPLTSAKVYVKQIAHYGAHHNLEKSKQITLHALDSLEMALPKTNLHEVVSSELSQVKDLLQGKDPQDILGLPVTEDPLVLAQMEVLSAAIAPAYIGFPDYLPLIVCRMMCISITKGNCIMSPFAYVNYAMLLCSLGDADTGYAYGKVAIELMEKLGAKPLFPKVYAMFGAFVHHWKAPAQDGLEFYEKAKTIGLEIGDYEFAAYTANYVMHASFYVGKSIHSLIANYPVVHKLLARFNKDHAIYGAKYWHQLLLTMNNPTGDGVSVSGEIIDENWLIPLLEESQDRLSLVMCFIGKMQLAYLAGDYKTANSVRQKAIDLLQTMSGLMYNTVCHFFAALSSIALFKKSRKDTSLIEDAKRSLEKLKKWGLDAPMNYLYKAELVEAELMAVEGKEIQALKLYEAATKNAQKAGNRLDLGVAYECMGRYLGEIGLSTVSKDYLRRSISVFHKWGALNKSTRLKKEFDIEFDETGVLSEQSDSTVNVRLDLETLAGTVKSLTRDFSFASFLATLLDAVMHSSGATRVVYIHMDKDRLEVRAEKLSNGKVSIYDGTETRLSSFDLPNTLIKRYLLGFSKYVLENIEVKKQSKGDNTSETRRNSILIIPLIRHQLVIGLVYLENDLMENAFREDHIQFLSLLAGQAAIAMENALIFETLNKERDYSSNIIHNSPSLICGIGSDGTITFVNPAATEITGYSKDELIGNNWWEKFYPGEEYRQLDQLFKAFDDGAVIDLEMTLTCKNNEKKNIIWNSFTKRDNNNNILEIIGFGNDITKRKRAEQALVESETKFRSITENAVDCIFIKDKTRRYTFINQAMQRLLGLPETEILGKTPEALFGKEQARIIKGVDDRAFSGETVNDISSLNIDGNQFIFSTLQTPLSKEDGDISSIMGIVRDITERRLLEEQLHQSEKMDAIGQLAGGIAHDFNNQLTGILGCAEFIRKMTKTYPSVNEYTDNIILSVKRASDLTSQLLAFSRKGKYLTVVIDIHLLVFEVIKLLKHSIDKRIVIKQDLRANPSTFKGDPTQLHNAVLNLALNARDAMPDGGELMFTTDITTLDSAFCQASPSDIVPGKYLVLSIADSGCGIDQKTMQRIFEPFFTTKDQGRGTGMGLAAVYGTVKAHKGAITLESTPGIGSTFRLNFPLVFAENAKVNAAKVHHESIDGTAHLLLVDDEEMICIITAKMLRRLGYTVSVCRNGKEAIEFYKEHWHDINLVILDLVMPVIGGKQAFAAMRDINPDIVAIVSSGYSINGEAQSIIKNGAKGFIQKPYSEAELSLKISKILKSNGCSWSRS